YTVTNGWNTLTLTTPLLWNGCDNIVVEVCAQNDSYQNNGNASTNYTTMSGTKTYVKYFKDDDTNVCSSDIGDETSKKRPNIRFNLSANSVNCGYTCNFLGTASSSSDIDLTWTGTGTSYKIEYGPTDFTLGTGTSVTTTSLTETISSLAKNTAYDFYIEQICTSGSSAGFYGPVTIKTLCNVVDDFFEGFEDMTMYENMSSP